jgi:hypothetical protein
MFVVFSSPSFDWYGETPYRHLAAHLSQLEQIANALVEL